MPGLDWAHFLRFHRKKPGYPLVSFLPQAKKDTASIPCAAQKMASMPFFELWGFCFAKPQGMCPQPASMPAGYRHLAFVICCFLAEVIQ
jgi:hypothetical protein